MAEPVILWEGDCAYALATKAGYEVRVHSSNHVIHILAGETADRERAERLTRRLNAYPRQTRAAYGLH